MAWRFPPDEGVWGARLAILDALIKIMKDVIARKEPKATDEAIPVIMKIAWPFLRLLRLCLAMTIHYFLIH